MKTMAIGLVLTLAVTAIILGPSPARAFSSCMTWQAQSGHDHYIGLGEELDGGGSGIGKLALCDYDDTSATYNYYHPGTCTTSSTSSNYVAVFGGSGIDRIFTFRSNHDCSSVAGTNTIGPWNNSWAFFLYGVGSGAGDTLHGTPNADVLYTNSDSNWSADTSRDDICGYAGNDFLYGDGDDSATTPYECIDGGTGSSDTCDGGEDSTTGDRKANCETFSYFSGTAGACSCATSDLWPF